MASNEQRNMNDTTMPPPPRPSSSQQSPNNRGKSGKSGSTSSSSTTSANATGSGRTKVALRKGFGLSDWHRLVGKSKDLAQRGHGQPLRRRIKMKEVAQHASIHDGWLVIRRKVYFISPYLPYHPGGENILRKVLGKDATDLYDKYHRWVNEDGLVGKLLIGYVDTSPDSDDDEEEDDNESPRNSYLPAAASTTIPKKDGYSMPAPSRPPPSKKK